MFRMKLVGRVACFTPLVGFLLSGVVQICTVQAFGPLQFLLRHWNLRNVTLHSGMLPYKSLEIFSASTVLLHGSIMLPPHRPRVFARLARWK